MNVRPVIAAYMQDPVIAALVGDRVALAQIPQIGSFAPQMEYNIISDNEEPEVQYNGTAGVLCRARVQFNPWAQTMAQVEAVHAALRAVMNYRHQITVGGKLLISVRVDLVGPASKDNDAGLWTQPVDYVLRYYD